MAEIIFYEGPKTPDKSEQFGTIEEARIRAEELAAKNTSSTIYEAGEIAEFWTYNYFAGKMEIDTV